MFFRSQRRGEWSDNYFMGVSILALLLLLSWPFNPQQLPLPALPIVLLILVKGYYRRKNKEDEDEI